MVTRYIGLKIAPLIYCCENGSKFGMNIILSRGFTIAYGSSLAVIISSNPVRGHGYFLL